MSPQVKIVIKQKRNCNRDGVSATPPENVTVCLLASVEGKLRQFVLDLHSGKLHREFHHGPDPTDSTPGQVGPPTPPARGSFCSIHWHCLSTSTLPRPAPARRRKREEKRPAALQRAPSRSWRPARPATPSWAGTATSCDLPATPWLGATALGQGGGSGGDKPAGGTEQQHPTPWLSAAREKEEEEEEHEEEAGGFKEKEEEEGDGDDGGDDGFQSTTTTLG